MSLEIYIATSGLMYFVISDSVHTNSSYAMEEHFRTKPDLRNELKSGCQ